MIDDIDHVGSVVMLMVSDDGVIPLPTVTTAPSPCTAVCNDLPVFDPTDVSDVHIHDCPPLPPTRVLIVVVTTHDPTTLTNVLPVTGVLL